MNLNPEITTVSGVVEEIGPTIAGKQLERDSCSKYSFLLVKKDDGSFIRINNAVLESDMSTKIQLGSMVTFYTRKFRYASMPWKGKDNLILALEDHRGIHVSSFPTKKSIALTIIGLVIFSALWYGAASMFGAFLYDKGNRDPIWEFGMAFSTGLLAIMSLMLLSIAATLFSLVRLRADTVSLGAQLSPASRSSYGNSNLKEI
ncbi:hypothetical protein C5748_07305 [Phyllobacterium phragmitis]|uniref:Uncharacterized protein n=1 Tax=Phyllobacterium phragmitis TaxID=2670329 RepID=A0A2S9IV39_9HYPH|nr:hypothetical protein [Phyllobacterium phragmitis]PRD44378.1 hypothetical protein C5748_07305 [Phyllobacterium phragmitis]